MKFDYPLSKVILSTNKKLFQYSYCLIDLVKVLTSYQQNKVPNPYTQTTNTTI